MTTLRPIVKSAMLIVGAATLCVVSGCSYNSADDASPGGTGAASELLAARPSDGGFDFRRGRMFFPLAVGNHWDYHVRTVNQLFTPDPQPPQVDENPLAIEIIGTESVGGREYFLQSEFDPRVVPPGGAVFRVRESRFGLFDLDTITAQSDVTVDGAPTGPGAAGLAAYVDRAVADPRQRASFHRAAVEVAARLALVRSIVGGLHPRPQAGGADPGEITLLSFPLYVGARWVVRDDPRFGRIVVARERVGLSLGTFPAWKIRGTSELFGPEDRVFFWYSNLGLLRVRYHIIANAVDNSGNVIGRVASDSDQSLTNIHLVGPGAGLVTGTAE